MKGIGALIGGVILGYICWLVFEASGFSWYGMLGTVAIVTIAASGLTIIDRVRD